MDNGGIGVGEDCCRSMCITESLTMLPGGGVWVMASDPQAASNTIKGRHKRTQKLFFTSNDPSWFTHLLRFMVYSVAPIP
jgi:hypothetical protein